MGRTCYYCGAPATTTEHVPPKCFFPEQVDSDGIDYRKNLITVPSCEEHNIEKSSDDEYLLFVLTCNLDANQVAKSHFATKVWRAISLKPNQFSRYIVNPEEIWVEENGILQKSMRFDADESRYYNVLTHIIRGIFFKEFKRTLLTGKIQIAYSSAMYINPVENIKSKNFDKETKAILAGIPYKGNNQEVFRYKIVGEGQNHILRMEFYELFAVIAAIDEGRGATA